ncbi:LOW QUALITY PROTEIN: 2-acylglycerol O-acyltransferase 3-like [Dugong dugon]
MEVSTAPPPSRTRKTLKKQRLETVAAYQFGLSFLFLSVFLSLLLLLLFTSFWSFSVLYLAWLYLDWDTPSQDGRHSEWIRNWTIWKHIRDYFPIKLVKTAELPPNQNYLMDAHLHMITCSRAFCNSGTKNQHRLTLWKHKAFVRLVLGHRASLVPVYSFGENDIFKVKAFATDFWQYCQMSFKKLIAFAPCIFAGCSLFLADSWGLLPFVMPITTVVGRPIQVPSLNPTGEEGDHYHVLYIKTLEQLFEEHRESYGVLASTHLTFL